MEEQVASEGDQTGSDADQSGSDADQTRADADQSAADADQVSSVADQVASDRDQAAANQELAAHPSDPEAVEAHEEGRIARRSGTRARDATAVERANTAQERSDGAVDRDDTAWRRDLAAMARDNAANARDWASERLELGLGPGGPELRAAIKHAAEVRAQAAADRRRAAADREQAAVDREQAAADREQALADLHRAHTDELTGAYQRGIGEIALQHEIDRARRAGESLVLAFVDIDGLKAVNDGRGHGAGDALLRDVVSAIRSKIRSYEPIVRIGGDEFLCSVAGADIEGARARFEEVGSILGDEDPPGSVSVGLADLRPEDNLADLIERADAALVEARGAKRA